MDRIDPKDRYTVGSGIDLDKLKELATVAAEDAARLRRQPDSHDANLLLALDLALDAYDKAVGR